MTCTGVAVDVLVINNVISVCYYLSSASFRQLATRYAYRGRWQVAGGLSLEGKE